MPHFMAFGSSFMYNKWKMHEMGVFMYSKGRGKDDMQAH